MVVVVVVWFGFWYVQMQRRHLPREKDRFLNVRWPMAKLPAHVSSEISSSTRMLAAISQPSIMEILRL